jgi:two-component system, chemotaxis family, chemotaxis protein CheY
MMAEAAPMVERMMERLRVLVVDDNHHMINIVKTILRGFGVKDFFDARDAVEAFDILRSTQIDIVVTDYSMEPITGSEFVRLIRTAEDSPNPYIPIVMLTAYSERSKVEEARDAGVNEFCAKPVTATDLYRKVCAVINAPRSFVRTSVYFGPDRRRRKDAPYNGSERRAGIFAARAEARDKPTEVA